ncbi:MAG: bifunctional DedA family/phosphatase PAP2 family protein [Solirubrobacterales bacterium]
MMKPPLPKGRARKVLTVVLVLALLAGFTVLLPKLGDALEEAIKTLADSLGKWAYLLIGLLAMAETAAALGLVAPGEVAVIIGGVLAGEGTLSIELLIGIVWVSAVIGDSIGFLLGHRLGRSFVDRHGRRFPTARRHFARVERFFEDHGGKSILIGRWIGIVRPLMPFTAGTSSMPYRRFVPYDVLGAGIWATAFCLLGYVFWRNFSDITRLAGLGAFALGVIIVAIVLSVRAVRQLRDPAQRARWRAWIERQAERPLLRPFAIPIRWLWRVVLRPIWVVTGPPLRFFVRRLTPGELGIELTTLLAIAGVCAYVIFLQIDLLDTDALIAGDSTALQISQDVQSGAQTVLARIVGLAGSFGVVTLVVAGAAGFLIGRRRNVEAIMLVSAFVATEIAVQIMKAAVERPRPADEVVHAGGYSYPSGHAAISIGFIAIGVLVARGADRAGARIAWVLAGVAAALLIGSSRVYLRVHYLSDVIGGWALGLAVFSLFGAVALVVDYLVRVGPPETTPTDAATPASRDAQFSDR